jgi:aryl-alcohol dehydrogenase-like predicted oxidoreductase
VKSACYPRLAQLAVTHIDLCYAHRLDLAVPVEDTVGAKAELVVAGKVRAIGLSEVSADELRSARGASDHRVAERLFDLGAVARIECHTCMPGAS